MRSVRSQSACFAWLLGVCVCGALQAPVYASVGLSADECVAMALKASPEAQAREANLVRARLSVRDASVALHPTLGNSVTVSRVGDGDPTVSGNLNLRLPYGQFLGATGPLANAVAFAAARVDMAWADAEASYASASAAIALEARSRFFRVLKARSDLDAVTASVDRTEKLVLPDVQSRFAKGFASQVDVLKAQAAGAAARIQLRKAAQALASCEKELASITGLAAVPGLAMASPDEAVVQKLLGTPIDELGRSALSKRADVGRAEREAERVRLQYEADRTALSPRLGVGASARMASDRPGDSRLGISASIGDVVRDGAVGASLSVSPAPEASSSVVGVNATLSLPNVVELKLQADTSKMVSLTFSAPLLSEGGKARRDAERSTMSHESSIKAPEEARKAVLSDVSGARATLLDAYDAWMVAKAYLQVADMGLKEAHSRFDAGLISQVGLSDAETEAKASQARFEQAGFDAILAVERLKLAIGEV